MTTPAHIYMQGDDAHWLACGLLYRDYHRRKFAAYVAFAEECYTTRGRVVSESHLRFMVGAYQTYRDLATVYGWQTMKPLRLQLPFSYFGQAGKKWRALDLTAAQVLDSLQRAARGELSSVTQMTDDMEITALLESDGNGETNGRRWVGEFLPGMMRFVETPPTDVPETVVTAMRTAVKVARDWLSE